MQYSLLPQMEENLLPFHGEVFFNPHFFSTQEADFLFETLQKGLSWRQDYIWMFGKQVLQPRLTALYGDPSVPYRYSGLEMHALPFSKELEEIKRRIEDYTRNDFTQVLCNFYRDGADSMGWHRDNEPVLGKNPTIASVTLGASRTFQLRPYVEKSPKISMDLTHGSLLLMSGESQHHWEHQVPKTKKVNRPRINLTFRKLFA